MFLENQPANIPFKEVFYGNTTRPNNKRMNRMELFAKQLKTVIGSSSSTFNLYSNELFIVVYDKINLVVFLTPEIEFVVILICLIQQMRSYSTLHPTPP